MDNLTNKNIFQYEFEGVDEDKTKVIITALLDKTTRQIEFWGHLKDYGISFMLYGLEDFDITGLDLRTYCEMLAYEHFDEILEGSK